MENKTRRALVAYNMHAHLRPGKAPDSNFDYEQMFAKIAEAPREKRIFDYRDRSIAVLDATRDQDIIALLFVAGEKNGSILTFDLDTFDAERQQAGRNRLYVQSRWMIVDPKQRVAILESKRPTVGLDEIEHFIEMFMANSMNQDRAEFSLNQIANPDFATSIERFSRIREASVVLSRPNSEWTDSANALVQSAASAGAKDIEVSARASRKQSLSKSDGIVARIIDLAKQPISFIKNARVTGNLPDSDGETTVSLEKSAMRSYANIEKAASPSQQLSEMMRSANSLLDRVRNTERDLVVRNNDSEVISNENKK